MPRIRTVKPAFWAHPAMGRASDGAKCLALALLNFADDEGFFQASPALVRNFARPFDATPERTDELMGEIWRTEWIEIRRHPTYGALGWVVKFRDHQVVSKPQKSTLKTYFDKAEKQSPPPPPDQHHSGPPPDRVEAYSSTDSSTTPSGKGREGKGMEEEEAVRVCARGPQPDPVAAPSDKPAAPGPETETQKPPLGAAAGELAAYLAGGWPELEDPETFARVVADAYPRLELVAVAKQARAGMLAGNPRQKPPVQFLRDWLGREGKGGPTSGGGAPTGSTRVQPSDDDQRERKKREEDHAEGVKQDREERKKKGLAPVPDVKGLLRGLAAPKSKTAAEGKKP